MLVSAVVLRIEGRAVGAAREAVPRREHRGGRPGGRASPAAAGPASPARGAVPRPAVLPPGREATHEGRVVLEELLSLPVKKDE